jgi:iron-sulfur cluster assembly protein
MVTVSEEASKKIKTLLAEESYKGQLLKIGVVGGGCSGLSYKLEFVSEKEKGDEEFESNGIKILVGKKSLLYLFGTELHHSDGLNGKGFHFKNPQASRTCGCGESFAI